MIAPNSVVLPAPLGPITVTIRPASIASDTPCTASTLPYATCRSRTSSSALIPDLSNLFLYHAAEIGLAHDRIRLDLHRKALGQFLAKVHHH